MENSTIVDEQKTMDTGTKKAIRQLRGWTNLCGWCHQFMMWETLGIFWNAWWLQRQLAERDVLAVVVAFSALIALASSTAFLSNKLPFDAIAGTGAPLLPRLQFAAVMRSITVAVLAMGWIVSTHMRSGSSSVAQTAQYLEYMWRIAAIGLVLVVVSLLVQPSADDKLKPYGKLLVIGGDVCTVLLVLLLKNTIAILELIFLHITIADVLLSKALRLDERELRGDAGSSGPGL